MSKLVYLACPYSHTDPAVMDARYQAAVKAAARIMVDYGHVVFSPIAHSHDIGKHLGKQAGGHMDGDIHAFWMRQDLPWLDRCDELWVLTLYGWEKSRGVLEEIEHAKKREMPVKFVSPNGYVVYDDHEMTWREMEITHDGEENYSAFDPVETQTFGPLADVKDTNPKDMIGTRKAPLSTVPAGVLAEIGVGMLEGASKYGRHNYRAAGIRASVYYDALQRHILAWWEGEDVDPDSKLNHVAKALCTLVVLRDAMMQDMWTDDRPPRSKAFYAELNQRAADIIDRYADRNPRHYMIADSKEPMK